MRLNLHGTVAVAIVLLATQARGQSVIGIRFEESVFGAKVEEVVTGSPAANAGIKPGDQVLNANGQEVNSPANVRAVLGQIKPGDRVTLTIIRNGMTKQFTLTTVTAQQLAAGAARVDPGREAVAQLRAVHAELIDPRRITRFAEFERRDTSHVEASTMAGEIRGLILEANRVSDQTLQSLVACPNLALIVIRGRLNDAHKFTGSGLAALRGHKNLRSLWFDEVNVGEEHVRQAGQLSQLTSLAFDRAAIQLPWMDHLKSLDKLEQLWLRQSSVGDEHLAILANFPRLKHLDLYKTRVNGPGLETVGKLKQLEYLDLEGTAVGDDGLKHLEACGELSLLDVSRTRITAAGLPSINKLAKLNRLFMNYCADEINDGGGLVGEPLRVAAAANGIDLTKRKARFTATQLCDQLSGLSHLTELSLQGIKYTPDEVRTLARKWPTALIRTADTTIRPAQ